MLLALVSVCATAAPIDLVALWNQVDEWKIDAKTSQVSSDDPCAKGAVAEIDLPNLFIAIDGAAGPSCEEKQRTELTVFTRRGKGGDPLLVRSTYGLYDRKVDAWHLTGGKLVEAPAVLEPIRGARLLPKELQRDGVDVERLEATYVLPQKGTTVLIKVKELGGPCKGLEPAPAVCAPAAAKKGLTVRAKWNAQEGRFELKP